MKDRRIKHFSALVTIGVLLSLGGYSKADSPREEALEGGHHSQWAMIFAPTGAPTMDIITRVGTIMEGSGQAPTRSLACEIALDFPAIQCLKLGLEISEMKCDCQQMSNGDWDCLGWVTCE